MLDTKQKSDMPKKLKGFTLVELLIVIAIISILVTMVLIALNPIRIINESKDSKARSELVQVKTSLQLYFNELNDYPASTAALAPTYIRVVPTGVTYSRISSTDYLASVAINVVISEDNESATRCGQATMAIGGAGTHYICPD